MSTPAKNAALRSLGRSAALAVGHRAAIAGYMLFALFPLFWLIKIAVTPDRLLYSEGIRLWPSSTTLANFNFVLLQSDFPAFFANSVMVSLGTALALTLVFAPLTTHLYRKRD
jgi:multiple sugar transport system permease protein